MQKFVLSSVILLSSISTFAAKEMKLVCKANELITPNGCAMEKAEQTFDVLFVNSTAQKTVRAKLNDSMEFTAYGHEKTKVVKVYIRRVEPGLTTISSGSSELREGSYASVSADITGDHKPGDCNSELAEFVCVVEQK